MCHAHYDIPKLKAQQQCKDIPSNCTKHKTWADFCAARVFPDCEMMREAGCGSYAKEYKIMPPSEQIKTFSRNSCLKLPQAPQGAGCWWYSPSGCQGDPKWAGTVGYLLDADPQGADTKAVCDVERQAYYTKLCFPSNSTRILPDIQMHFNPPKEAKPKTQLKRVPAVGHDGSGQCIATVQV